MRQVAEIVRFSPLAHTVAMAHLPYEKAENPDKDPVWISISKDLNSLGYRCDEFTNDHQGLPHILFSGCSVSYGTGLFLQEVWTRKVWEDLGPSSGYFNLSMEGNSIPNIVFEIIKYCSIYGNPNKIFINLPDPYRSMQPAPGEPGVFMFDRVWPEAKKPNENEFVEMEKLRVSAFQSYKILELFCSSHGIELKSFSWSVDTDDILGDGSFKTFNKLNKSSLADKVLEYATKSSDPVLSISARDPGKHYGLAYHQAFYDFYMSD